MLRPFLHVLLVLLLAGGVQATAAISEARAQTTGGTPPKIVLAGDQLSVVSASVNPNGAHAAIDGDEGTYWTVSGGLPQEIVLELPALHYVTAVRYVHGDRTANYLTQYKVYASEDGANWINTSAPGAIKNTALVWEIRMSWPKNARFIKLAFLGSGGGSSIHAAEISVISETVTPPPSSPPPMPPPSPPAPTSASASQPSAPPVPAPIPAPAPPVAPGPACSAGGKITGKSYFVSPNGSGGACTQSSPCSLQSALDKAGPGDEVVLKDGVYSGAYDTRSGGVTIRAENQHKAVLHALRREAFFRLRHSGITMRGLRFDGRRVSGAITTKAAISDIVIEDNIIENTDRSGMAVGGAFGAHNWIIRHNLIQDTGFGGPGEGMYIGKSAEGNANVGNIQIYGNVLRRYTSNGIDMKPGTHDIEVHHNIFEEQLYRPNPNKPEVESGIVANSGRNRSIHDNVFRNIDDAGRAVLEPSGNAGDRVSGNVVYNVRKVGDAIGTRSRGAGGTSVVENNTFCNVASYSVEAKDGLMVRHNTGLPGGAPMSACQSEEQRILSEMRLLPRCGGIAASPRPAPAPMPRTSPQPQPAPAPASSSTGELSIVSARASGTQFPRKPVHAYDGNDRTRWSARGRGQWIAFDLGAATQVSQVAIDWYKGESRRQSFTIEVSADGRTWQRVYQGRGDGKTVTLETYSFTPEQARYVRIVGYGNTENQWNSITEVKLYGRK